MKPRSCKRKSGFICAKPASWWRESRFFYCWPEETTTWWIGQRLTFFYMKILLLCILEKVPIIDKLILIRKNGCVSIIFFDWWSNLSETSSIYRKKYNSLAYFHSNSRFSLCFYCYSKYFLQTDTTTRTPPARELMKKLWKNWYTTGKHEKFEVFFVILTDFHQLFW